MFAAAMSSIDSGVNSVTAVVMTDFRTLLFRGLRAQIVGFVGVDWIVVRRRHGRHDRVFGAAGLLAAHPIPRLTSSPKLAPG